MILLKTLSSDSKAVHKKLSLVIPFSLIKSLYFNHNVLNPNMEIFLWVRCYEN